MSLPTLTILGSPLAECAKFGVCQITECAPDTWIEFQSDHLRKAKALLSLSTEGDLVFVFSQAGMLPETRATFFRQPFFRVDSPKVLSEALCVALGVMSLVVQAGLYPITATDEGYTVAFPQVAFNVFICQSSMSSPPPLALP